MPLPAGHSDPSPGAPPIVMSEVEYARMDRFESGHWWYVGLRDLLARVLDRFAVAERPDLHVLDAGCGTGENLRMCAVRMPAARLSGFDASERALEYARHKVPQAELCVGDVRQPPFHHERVDLILSCDVLQITGMDEARRGMYRLAAQLRPGGLLVVNLPAYQWLFSRHDIAVATRYRFTARQVQAFLGDLGLQPAWLSYRLCLLFPAIVATRLPSLLRKPVPADSSSGRSDLTTAPAWLNQSLIRLVRWENSWIARGRSWPWGSSVFAVARRV